MKKITFLFLLATFLSRVSFSQTENRYTLAEKITQSTIHDAIQLYHAKHGLTFYFRPVIIPSAAVANYEVYDLYHQKSIGNLTDFAKEFNVQPSDVYDHLADLMEGFLKKYNGRQMYVMGQLNVTPGDSLATYCDSIWKRILKRNSGVAGSNWESVYQDNKYLGSEFLNGQVKNLLVPPLSTAFIKSLDIARITSEDMGGFGPSAKTVGKALATILIEKANEEINAAVFRRLKKVIEDVEELKLLFPETAELLITIESYNFDAALNTLREKLEKDIQNLLGNIPELAKLKKYSKRLAAIPELTYFFVTCDIANGLKNNANPGEMIQKIYARSYISDQSNIHANIIQLVGFVSYSLRDVMEAEKTSNNNNWINSKLLAYDLASVQEISKYYLGLMVASSPDIIIQINAATTSSTFNFKESLNNAQPTVSKTYEILNKTLESVRLIEDEIVAIKALEAVENISLQKYAHYEVIVKEVLTFGETFVSIPGIPQQQNIIAVINQARNFYLPLAKEAVSVASNIEQKKYSEAVYDVGNLFEMIATKIKPDTTKKDIDKYFQYGQLLASIAVAEDAEDVKKAIEAVALPAGSSSLKKDAQFNVALNGYIGYFYRDMGSADFAEGFTQSHGITAPVGFTFSFGLRKCGSVSVLAGILDVGAIVQYELKDDASAAEPVIEWGNIISPSVHLVYGLPFYVPLSIGVGGQWLPSDASVKDSNYKLTSRLNAFIAFDIPFFNITSTKKKRN